MKSMKKLFPIMLVLFTNILGAGVILPVLPLYAQGQFKGTIPQVTLLASAFFGAQFLAAPWLGRLSDRYGRRPILMVSQLGTVLAFIIFIFAGPLGTIIDGFAPGLPLTGGMIILFTARILDGITGGNITTAQAYVNDITTDKERARGLGLLQAAFGAGFIFGPALGGILGAYGSIAPFIGATIITTGTLLLTAFTLKESLPPQERTARQTGKARSKIPFKALIAERTLLLMLLIGFLASLAFSSMPAIFSLFADHVIFSEEVVSGRVRLYIGLMLTFLGLMQVVTQLAFIKPLVDRLGERRTLILGDIALALAFSGMALAANPFVVAALLGVYAFGQGVSEPSMQSLMTRFGDRRTGGYLLGLYQSARSLALIFGPIMAGYIYASGNPRAVFVAGGGVMLITLIGSVLLLKRPIKPIEAAHPPITETFP
jgi:DHA1 family tetracycline resistance protein-like MFS transporter